MPAKQAERKTWQQTKSENTRTQILDAAVRCFYEQGYANTATESVAAVARVSRGAMLHHFPTRFDLIRATVEHLSRQRLEIFEAREAEAQRGAVYTRVEAGIDAYWQQLNTPTFVVFQELIIAARTDKELEKVLKPALEAFEVARWETTKRIFPDLALSEAFIRANYLTRFMLEGMAAASRIDGPKVPVKKMLLWLKRELRRSFQDVLGRVERPTAPD